MLSVLVFWKKKKEKRKTKREPGVCNQYRNKYDTEITKAFWLPLNSNCMLVVCRKLAFSSTTLSDCTLTHTTNLHILTFRFCSACCPKSTFLPLYVTAKHAVSIYMHILDKPNANGMPCKMKCNTSSIIIHICIIQIDLNNFANAKWKR